MTANNDNECYRGPLSAAQIAMVYEEKYDSWKLHNPNARDIGFVMCYMPDIDRVHELPRAFVLLSQMRYAERFWLDFCRIAFYESREKDIIELLHIDPKFLPFVWGATVNDPVVERRAK